MKKDRSGAKEETAATRKSGRRTSWRGRLLWLAGVAILAAGAVVYTVPVLEGLEAQRTEIADSTAELDALVAENAELQDRLDSLNTPIEIERLARERLGYVREGETAFVVVPVPAEPPPPAAEEADEASTPEQVPWYREWWNYLSGSDLAADS